MLRNICCLSVVGGWQTAFEGSEVTFGPVFNKIQDLWAWQSENLYAKEWI